MSAWAGPLLQLLRVPPRPHLPAGDPRTARVFRAAPGFWRLRLAGWGLKQAVTFSGFVFLAGLLSAAPGSLEARTGGRQRSVPITTLVSVARGFEGVAIALWVLQLPLTLAVLRLDYEMRWYVVTDRAARLREGVLGVTEMTLTLVNVQDIRIRQGPLQRLLGIADVELRTAGGGEPGQGSSGHHGRNLHLARFRGVDNAEQIRDLVRDRMRMVRDAGLGDPDDVSADTDAPSLDDAVRELARESAALRRAAERLLLPGAAEGTE